MIRPTRKPLQPHEFVVDPDVPPYCRCSLPKRNKIHVPPKDHLF